MSGVALSAVLAPFALLILVACVESDQGPEVAQAALAIHDSVDWQATEEPDVVLLLARANADLTESGAHDGQEELRRQLEHLIGLRTEGDQGGWGWGLSYSWDAFGDGVRNPADTIYSYTTAAAALAFLDGYEVLDDERYLTAARHAADALLKETCCWRSGDYLSVWYSNQQNDQRRERQIHNVNGLALAVLSRLDEHLPAPQYEDERAAMAAHLLDEQGDGYSREVTDETEASEANWRYMRGEERPNDLLHETFIVEGLLAHGTKEAIQAARASLDGISRIHFSDEGKPREGTHTFGSLDWGPAAGLFILASSEHHRTRAGEVARYVVNTVDRGGRSTLADRDELRAQAWYALGLARYANEVKLSLHRQ